MQCGEMATCGEPARVHASQRGPCNYSTPQVDGFAKYFSFLQRGDFKCTDFLPMREKWNLQEKRESCRNKRWGIGGGTPPQNSRKRIKSLEGGLKWFIKFYALCGIRVLKPRSRNGVDKWTLIIESKIREVEYIFNCVLFKLFSVGGTNWHLFVYS